MLGDADYWWSSISHNLDVCIIIMQSFEEMFYSQFFNEISYAIQLKEFSNLVQGHMNMASFEQNLFYC